MVRPEFSQSNQRLVAVRSHSPRVRAITQGLQIPRPKFVEWMGGICRALPELLGTPAVRLQVFNVLIFNRFDLSFCTVALEQRRHEELGENICNREASPSDQCNLTGEQESLQRRSSTEATEDFASISVIKREQIMHSKNAAVETHCLLLKRPPALVPCVVGAQRTRG